MLVSLCHIDHLCYPLILYESRSTHGRPLLFQSKTSLCHSGRCCTIRSNLRFDSKSNHILYVKSYNSFSQLPQQAVFVRNAVSYFEFSAFFIMLHFYQERIDRRMFILRAQLKASFKAQQHAQIAEKVAASSKRRFVSCMFCYLFLKINFTTF